MTLASFKMSIQHNLPFEISRDLLTYEPGADTKNIKLKQHLCVRHAMPKTNLYGTILHENVSQDRHLERQLTSLSVRQLKNSNSFDLSARTFMKNQERKQAKWRREDEFRLSGLNLPNVQIAEEKRRPSFDVMYKAPEYNFRSQSVRGKENLPKMPFSIRREKTEIVTHRERTFMTRLPEVMVVDQDALKEYNKYRGKLHLKPGAPTKDDRFQKLHSTLSQPLIKDSDDLPNENSKSKSRLSKYSYESHDDQTDKSLDMTGQEADDTRPPWMMTRAQTDMILKKKQRNAEEDTFSIHQPNRSKSNDILESFRTKDVKQLAKSLSKNRAEKDKNGKDSVTFVPGVNVYYSTKK
ncbi:uncharacterized protein LOC143046417 [Mytilus galloprovincialis]|uniref:Uncharacterized protein n=3 Tax=Mytilus TaxID=6548 RepID=A0A8B6CI59_MYTGA|nr:unnamed protein product [Mytilus edulis]VDI05101.1 Hypothetical predicted protein [Mytilus galloprovincialis]